MQGLLDFPCDVALAASTRSGLRGHTSKIRQQRCKTRRHQNAFSVRVVPCWSKLPEDIVNASSVEIFDWMHDGSPSSQKSPDIPSTELVQL